MKDRHFCNFADKYEGQIPTTERYKKMSIKSMIVAIGLLAGLPAQAQMHRYDTSFTVSQHHFVDTIPLELDDDQLYVPIRIGEKTYRFNLDTGSSQGMLYYGTRVPVVKELGHVVSYDANGVADTTLVVQLPEMQLGRLTIAGYVAAVKSRKVYRNNFDGIIGFDLFNKGIAGKIDPKRKCLILTDIKGYFDNEPGHTLKYKLVRFVPYVLVSPFMRHTDLALFDTGARQLYQMNREHFFDHRYKSKQVNAQVEGEACGNFAIGTNSTEKQDIVYFLNLDRLKWDDFSFARVRAITTQGDSRIGAQLFNYGSVVVNPWKKQLTFSPNNGADSVSVSNRQFGVAFIDKDDQAAIGLIWHKSDAYKNGMRQGDIVLKINDEPIDSYRKFTAYRFADGHTYKFVLRDRRGFDKEVSVTR